MSYIQQQMWPVAKQKTGSWSLFTKQLLKQDLCLRWSSRYGGTGGGLGASDPLPCFSGPPSREQQPSCLYVPWENSRSSKGRPLEVFQAASSVDQLWPGTGVLSWPGLHPAVRCRGGHRGSIFAKAGERHQRKLEKTHLLWVSLRQVLHRGGSFSPHPHP